MRHNFFIVRIKKQSRPKDKFVLFSIPSPDCLITRDARVTQTTGDFLLFFEIKKRTPEFISANLLDGCKSFAFSKI